MDEYWWDETQLRHKNLRFPLGRSTPIENLANIRRQYTLESIPEIDQESEDSSPDSSEEPEEIIVRLQEIKSSDTIPPELFYPTKLRDPEPKKKITLKVIASPTPKITYCTLYLQTVSLPTQLLNY